MIIIDPTLEQFKNIILDASSRMSGADRRAFQANITNQHLEGNARKAESYFGWGRESVAVGIKELETNIECLYDHTRQGAKKTEEKYPQLAEDIHALVDPKSQVDPKFQSPFAYTKITAKKVRSSLIESKGYSDAELPTERTISSILNRLGFKLTRIQKTKPQKKIAETDDIFTNLHQVNQEADKEEETLRISIDSKAKVNIGEFSRGGKSREAQTPQGADHDMGVETKLVPFGVLEVVSGQLTVVMGTSKETSDFVVDGLQLWWDERKDSHGHINKLVVNLDNGPCISSHRTQFLKRMIAFSTENNLIVHLAYYPPYHSKYNPIEHCWGALERYWNGTLLYDIETAIEWTKNMTWKGIRPIVRLLDEAYELGVKLTKKEMEAYKDKIVRSGELPKWDVTIHGNFDHSGI